MSSKRSSATIIIAITLYLIAVLKIHGSSFGSAITVSIIMAGVTLIITIIAQWLGIRASMYQDRGCLIIFIIMDAHCIGLQIPSLVTLAAAGLPWNCSGVANDPESSVYSVLEHTLKANYCTILKLNYWLAIFSILGYIFTIILETRRIITLGQNQRSNELNNEQARLNCHTNISGYIQMAYTLPIEPPPPYGEAKR